MKTFLQHLAENQKTYEFRIKVANIDLADKMDQLESVLEAYALESISKPKRLPIKESDIDFPSIRNCQVYLMDAVLKYPCTEAQLRSIISERAGVPQANLVVVPKNHPEEIWRWNEDGSSEIKEYKQGDAELTKPYPEATAEQKAAGEGYAKAETILKELTKPAKNEIAGDESADSKTLNDVPTGDKSPVGSTKNKLPTAR
jgi:hypothetical protein